MDPGGPSPSHYGARRPFSVEPGGPPTMEPGGPMWSQEALCGARRPYVEQEVLLCRTRSHCVEPGGPMCNQEALSGSRRTSVEPGFPPL